MFLVKGFEQGTSGSCVKCMTAHVTVCRAVQSKLVGGEGLALHPWGPELFACPRTDLRSPEQPHELSCKTYFKAPAPPPPPHPPTPKPPVHAPPSDGP